MRNETYNLDAIADQAMTERGFVPFAPDEVFKELDTINNPAVPAKDIRDLRQLDWFSIDNDNSKDLDQLTYAEKVDGKNIIYIAIADVDALVKKNTSVDAFAQTNTTSIYTPTKIYPMLPIKLSNNLTSLNENEDRVALVTEIQVWRRGALYGVGCLSRLCAQPP